MNKSLSSVLKRMSELPSFAGIKLDSPNVKGVFGEYPIHIAVVQGDAEAVKTLIDGGASIDSKGEHGYTPLHEAVEQGNSEIVSLLVALNADVNLKNDDNLTSLELSSLLNKKDILDILRSKRTI